LSYVQGDSVDVWKENILEDLEAELLEYKIVKEFLVEIKKKFGGEDEETVKVVELKRLEQGGKTMEKFIQEFRRVARESGYKRRPLVEEFKRDMNRMICQRLIKLEWQSSSIEQWYDKAIALDRNWRESRREEERRERYARRERESEEKKEEDKGKWYDKCKKSSRRMGDMGQGRKSSKVRS